MRMMFLIEAAVAVFSAGAAPLNIAVYVDAGARNVGVFRWLEIASRAKDAVLTPVDADAIRAGALDSADVLVMPFSGRTRKITKDFYHGRKEDVA